MLAKSILPAAALLVIAACKDTPPRADPVAVVDAPVTSPAGSTSPSSSTSTAPAPGPESPESRFQRLVDQLARFPDYESKGLGSDGVPSEAYIAYEAVAKLASKAQVHELLGHPSPVVRAYFAQHIIATLPDELPAVYPLLRDTTVLRSREGCGGDHGPLGELVMEWLISFADSGLANRRPRPAFMALFRRAAKDPGLPERVRKSAKEMLAPI